jgi:hypothetical protein
MARKSSGNHEVSKLDEQFQYRRPTSCTDKILATPTSLPLLSSLDSHLIRRTVFIPLEGLYTILGCGRVN